jgi:hypothetical protein
MIINAPMFLFFCLSFVCPMLPVSLDGPFLIAPSVFANVYLFQGRTLIVSIVFQHHIYRITCCC